MKIFAWIEKKMKVQTIWDIGILKIFCCLVGMILGGYLSAFVLQNVTWFYITAFILFIILMIRFFTGKKSG